MDGFYYYEDGEGDGSYFIRRVIDDKDQADEGTFAVCECEDDAKMICGALNRVHHSISKSAIFVSPGPGSE